MDDSKNNLAWINLFDKYQIPETIRDKGHFVITSQQINEFREARLMTKFDFKSQLPEIFLNNQLSVLPISRGSYIISDFNTFCNFDNNQVKVHKTDFPQHIESIDYKNITSESIALNCAFVTGILNDFCGDSWLKPTVSGRMSSSSFKFQINSKGLSIDVNVNNAQIEIDGGYEGLEALYLIEAKNSISNDFIIRQLYYPFRLWNQLIKKPVKPIYLTYTNGIFHLREFIFDDIYNYNSIRLFRQKKYAIRERRIRRNNILNLLNETIVINEPEVPFPQADSFERLINLCELLYVKSCLSREEITGNYDFDVRQTNYYTDAGNYLGLIEKTKDNGLVMFTLTQDGKQLMKMNFADRQIEFARLIVSHQAFHQTLRECFSLNHEPSKLLVIEIMKNAQLYHVKSESTYSRRSSTVIGWVRWILSLIDE